MHMTEAANLLPDSSITVRIQRPCLEGSVEVPPFFQPCNLPTQLEVLPRFTQSEMSLVNPMFAEPLLGISSAVVPHKVRTDSVIVIVSAARSVLANRNFNALGCKALTESCTLDDSRKLFGAEDLEHVRESGRENRGVSSVQCGWTARLSVVANVDEVHFEPIQGQ